MRLVVPWGIKTSSSFVLLAGRGRGCWGKLQAGMSHRCLLSVSARKRDKDLLCHNGGKKEASSQPEGINLGADDLEGFAEVGGFL